MLGRVSGGGWAAGCLRARVKSARTAIAYFMGYYEKIDPKFINKHLYFEVLYEGMKRFSLRRRSVLRFRVEKTKTIRRTVRTIKRFGRVFALYKFFDFPRFFFLSKRSYFAEFIWSFAFLRSTKII